MPKDYYKILGISRSASKEEIKKAYRQRAHQYHPDKKGGDEVKFKEVNEAYHVLSDEAKRAQYDQFGTTFDGGGGAGFGGGFGDFSQFWSNFGSGKGQFRMEDLGFNDIFSDVFGGFGGKRRRDARHGKDVSIEVEVFLEEVFGGIAKEIQLKKLVTCEACKGMGNKPGTTWGECAACGGRGEVEQIQRSFFGEIRRVGICPVCRGEGKKPKEACRDCGGEGRLTGVDTITINIPPGVSDGAILKIDGRGERGIRGAAAGDLYVTIHVRSHPHFKRDGDDIFVKQEISFTQAALGGKINILTLGGRVTLKIPPGIESGKLIRLKEKGLPHLYGGGKGDQYVEVYVKTPKKLTKEQKELIEKLKEEGI